MAFAEESRVLNYIFAASTCLPFCYCYFTAQNSENKAVFQDVVVLLDGSDSFNRTLNSEAFDVAQKFVFSDLAPRLAEKFGENCGMSLVQFSGIKKLTKSYIPGKQNLKNKVIIFRLGWKSRPKRSSSALANRVRARQSFQRSSTSWQQLVWRKWTVVPLPSRCEPGQFHWRTWNQTAV